jgi:hypothetical protein
VILDLLGVISRAHHGGNCHYLLAGEKAKQIDEVGCDVDR